VPASKKVIAEQIKRFIGCPNFPENQDELIRAFKECAVNDVDAIEIGDYLVRNCRPYAPVHGQVYEAKEAIAEFHRNEGCPSPYDQPGSEEGNLAEELTEEQFEGYLRMARQYKGSTRPAHRAIRDYALACLKAFWERHPERRLQEEL
jgi:hypothetical protein